MGIYEHIDNASFEELRAFWDNPTPSWVDSRESFIEELSYSLSKIKPEGINFLKSFAYSEDIDKRIWSIYFLADKEIVDNEIIKYLIDMLNSDNNTLKNYAIIGFIHIEKFPIQLSVIEKLLDDTDKKLAAHAMVYLSYALPEKTVNILRDGLLSPNARKREFACDEVGDRGIYQLKDYLKNLLDDSDEYVRQAAKINLEFFE